jgi:hypothetical protein
MKKRPKNPASEDRIQAFREAVRQLEADEFVEQFKEALRTLMKREAQPHKPEIRTNGKSD